MAAARTAPTPASHRERRSELRKSSWAAVEDTATGMPDIMSIMVSGDMPSIIP